MESLCLSRKTGIITFQWFFFFFKGRTRIGKIYGPWWGSVLFVTSRLVHCLARIFNAAAICVLSDIFQHFRRNKRRYIDGVLLLLLSHFSRVRLCATPQTAAHQALLSLRFSRQEYWSRLPFPSPYVEYRCQTTNK